MFIWAWLHGSPCKWITHADQNILWRPRFNPSLPPLAACQLSRPSLLSPSTEARSPPGDILKEMTRCRVGLRVSRSDSERARCDQSVSGDQCRCVRVHLGTRYNRGNVTHPGTYFISHVTASIDGSVFRLGGILVPLFDSRENDSL